MPKLQQQGIVHIGLILLLLAGLIAGVYLVQHPQIFQPKASGDVLWLVDEKGERLSLKEGTDVYQVSSQQIHIKINQPKWQASLPGLVGQALAQSACNGAVYSCSDIKCDDDSTAPGTGCYEKDNQGNLTDPNNRYRTECRRNCPTTTQQPASPQQPAGQTGQPAQPQVDNTTPIISGSVTWTADNFIAIPGANFGSDGIVYYSAGGDSQTAFSRDQISWSSSLIKTNNDRIPECTAVKTVDCLIRGGYVKVCRSDSKCSGFAQIPDRQIKQEPASGVLLPAAPQGAPAAPTQEKVTEATDKMRISMDQSKLQSDEACTEDADPQKHCLKFTPGDLAARAQIGKDYVDWWLANTPGEVQTIYVRFVSNKGKDYKLNGLDPSFKVIYQPAQVGQPPAGGAGGAGASPAKPSCQKVGVCVNKENKTSGNATCLGEDVNEEFSCSDPAYPICVTGSVVCTPAQAGAGGAGASPSPSVRPASPSPAASPSPLPPAPAVPLTGKVKITANGIQYNKVKVEYSDDNEKIKQAQLKLEVSLPTNVNQEGSYTTEPLRRSQIIVWLTVFPSEGWVGIVNSSKVDCPDRRSPLHFYAVGCYSQKGSTQQDLSVSLPLDSGLPLPVPDSQVFLGPLEGSPENPDPHMIYVKNNSDQKVTVQKVEQLTSEPVFSFWFVQIGAEYTQLDCKPESAVLSSKQYASCEAIVIACSRSDMENKKEKEVKVKYAIGEGSFDSATGQTGKVVQIATGRYQCGGAGLVNIP